MDLILYILAKAIEFRDATNNGKCLIATNRTFSSKIKSIMRALGGLHGIDTYVIGNELIDIESEDGLWKMSFDVSTDLIVICTTSNSVYTSYYETHGVPCIAISIFDFDSVQCGDVEELIRW